MKMKERNHEISLDLVTRPRYLGQDNKLRDWTNIFKNLLDHAWGRTFNLN